MVLLRIARRQRERAVAICERERWRALRSIHDVLRSKRRMSGARARRCAMSDYPSDARIVMRVRLKSRCLERALLCAYEVCARQNAAQRARCA